MSVSPPDYSSPSACLGQIMLPYPNFRTLANTRANYKIYKDLSFFGSVKYTGKVSPFNTSNRSLNAAHFFNSTASLLSQLARNVVEQSLEETGNRPSRDVSVDRDHLRAHRSLDCWQRVGCKDRFFVEVYIKQFYDWPDIHVVSVSKMPWNKKEYFFIL